MEVDIKKLITLFAGIIGLIFLPLGMIWAINTLLSLSIQYTFLNWLSIVFIQLYIQIVLKAAFLGTRTK